MSSSDASRRVFIAFSLQRSSNTSLIQMWQPEAQGRRASSPSPGFERSLFRVTVERKSLWCGEEDQVWQCWWEHPSPSRAQRAGCEAECFDTMFTFLMLFFQGRTCLGALQKLLSLGPKNSISWLQMDLASPGLSVQLLASPDLRALSGGLSLIQICLNVWVVSFWI